MVRKEQIKEAAGNIEYSLFYNVDDELKETLMEIFQLGAEWSDSNPSKEFINKACKWLENNLMDQIDASNKVSFSSVNFYECAEDFINCFRKAMEE